MDEAERRWTEFQQCIFTTYVSEDPDSGAHTDLRDQRAEAFAVEHAFLWLEPENFAAAFSRGLAVPIERRATAISLGRLRGRKLASELRRLAAAGQLPLVAKVGHPAERALPALLADGDVGPEIYRWTAVLLSHAAQDPAVRPFVWLPGQDTVFKEES